MLHLIVRPPPLLLELGVEGGDGLPVHRGAPLVGVDQRQQRAELDLASTGRDCFVLT